MSAIGSRADLSDSLEHGSVTTGIAYEGTLAVKGSHRLYEQKQTAPEGAAALDDYLRRWRRWTTAGLEGLTVCYALPALQPKAHKAKRE